MRTVATVLLALMILAILAVSLFLISNRAKPPLPITIKVAERAPEPEDPPEPLDPKTQALVEQIAAASDAKEAARGYVTLSKNADRKLLAQLKQVKQTGVALRAAWKSDDAKRFLGFVQRRLGMDPPSSWQDRVRRGHLEEHGRDDSERIEWRRKRRADTIAMLKEKSVVLQPAIFRNGFGADSPVMALVTPESCFLAFPTDLHLSYPLVCINRHTGETRWESTVWDAAFWGKASGNWMRDENVALVEKGETIFVFGAALSCFYIEAFESKSGRPLFRFVSQYSEERHATPP